jgi:outer membrane protein OmpA-like peptidoglycan-associated protein
MVVTAEPYFAVTQPSDVVVMENRLRSGTRGNIETVAAKYELLKRGSYTKDIGTPVPSSSKDDKTPLDLKEARNAITLARAAGADKYAAETFSKATYQLSEAERNPKKLNSREAIMAARGAVQTAEDSRLIALRRIDEERLAEERRLAQERTDKAKAEADAAAARALAEADARKAADLNAQRAAAQKAEADAARVAAERARAEAEVARREASREADRLAREREAADAARQRAIAAQQAAQQDADEARDLAAKAERDRMELRARLQQQLNVVLETKETARGLIVNMSDVLFDVGKATLKPDAREKLARVSGILSTHPDLKLQVEGHTDSTGGDEFNQKLSEERAASTRDYLVGLGITATSITAKGLGESQPVASNETAAGRQQNRRVELVISGESIQSQIH